MKDLGFYHLLPYIDALPSGDPFVIAVAGGSSPEILRTCARAAREGIAHSILFGDPETIRGELDGLSAVPGEGLSVRDSTDPALDAALAVGNGEAHVLMKGSVSSGAFLRAALSERTGLRTDALLSHVGFFDIPSFPRLLGMTDGGINISPDFDARVAIVANAASIGRRVLGRTPRIALVAAVEKVQSSMPVTMEYAAIAKMAERGSFGDAHVDGPLGLDNALNAEAACSKGLRGPVAGAADIVVVPDIQSGNVMGKTLTYLADAPMAGLVIGARAPIVLNSRADSSAARLASVILAASVAGGAFG